MPIVQIGDVKFPYKQHRHYFIIVTGRKKKIGSDLTGFQTCSLLFLGAHGFVQNVTFSIFRTPSSMIN